MIARKDDIAAYDEAFEDWWETIGAKADLTHRAHDPDRGPATPSRTGASSPPTSRSPWARPPRSGTGSARTRRSRSPTRRRRSASWRAAPRCSARKSFGDLTDDERARVAALIRRLAVSVPAERTRRTRPASEGCLVRSASHAPTFAAHAGRAVRPRLARAQVAHAPPRADPRHQRLDGPLLPRLDAVRVRRDGRRPAGGDLLLRDAAHARDADRCAPRTPTGRCTRSASQVQDWEGGTRIGESLKALLDGWSQRAALRGAVVVLCSDGLERGDPELLRPRWRGCAASPTAWSG